MNRRHFLKFLGISTLLTPLLTTLPLKASLPPNKKIITSITQNAPATIHQIQQDIEQCANLFTGEVNDKHTRNKFNSLLTQKLNHKYLHHHLIQNFIIVNNEITNPPSIINNYSMQGKVLVQFPNTISYYTINFIIQ